MIYHGPDHGHSDVGIGLELADNVAVYNNTIYHEHPYSNGIEYRFTASSSISISNNLSNKAIRSRNGGTAQLSNNVTDAQAQWFVDPSAGDLHLVADVEGVSDAEIPIANLTDVIDRQSRYINDGVDIGADEMDLTPPAEPKSNNTLAPTYLLLLE